MAKLEHKNSIENCKIIWEKMIDGILFCFSKMQIGNLKNSNFIFLFADLMIVKIQLPISLSGLKKTLQ
jgi:hypothetical protein